MGAWFLRQRRGGRLAAYCRGHEHDDDTPPAAAAVVPEAGNGWSVEDRRTLIITVVGGLAANLGTVILVGAAIALTRVNKHHSPGQPRGQLIAVAAVLIFGPFVIAAFHAARRGLASAR